MSRVGPLATALIFVLSAIGGAAQVDLLLEEWVEGPDRVHQAVQLHEEDPLSKTAKQVRPILMAHFKEVDYIICGDVIGPLMESKKGAHQIIAWQIIFGSGDWVEQHPERSEDIDAYTLAGLESGLRAYAAVLKTKPKVRVKLLDELLGLYENDDLQSWVDEHPCRAE
jgi:hypothetical protein